MPAYDYTVEAALRLNQASLRRVQSEITKGLSNLSGEINVKTSTKARQDVDALVGRLKAVPAAATKAKHSLHDLEEQFKGIGGQVDKAGHKVQQFSHQTSLAFRRFAAFTVATSGVSKFVSAMDDAIKQAIDFDREMVRLNQVSEESRATIAGIASDVSTLARNLGVSSAELIKGAVVFKQAGLNINETRQALDALAKSALAPNFDSVADTAEGMIAIMRQFKIPAGEMEKSLGSLNAVAGAFAVEASDLITAIKKTGGAFNAAAGDSKNTSLAFNELLAVFTSVRSTTRESAAEIATGLRTIFSRLQRQDTINALKQLNVNLRFTREELVALGQAPSLEGQFVGAYEAVRRLSEALNTIPETDARFSAIIETLGGVRQISRVIPLIQQQTESQKALNVAQAGSISLSVNAEQAQGALAVQLQKVKEEWLSTGRAISNDGGFRSTIDALGSMAKHLATISSLIGPLLPAITALFAKSAFENLAKPLISQSNAAQNFGRSVNRISSAGSDYLRGRGYATGGKVLGSGVTDNQHILAQPGEYVIPKQVARQVGYGNLDTAFRSGGLAKFQSGGEASRLRLQQHGPLYRLAAPDQLKPIKYILPGHRVSSQLTKDERDAIRDYTDGSLDFEKAPRYEIINKHLFGGYHGNSKEETRELYRSWYGDDIDEVIAKITSGVNKGRLPGGVDLYRGIGKNRLRKLFGKMSSRDVKVGQEITDGGFSSFSTDRDRASDFGSILLRYRTSKDQSGLFLGSGSLSKSIDENEVLHPPGSRFRVKSNSGDGKIELERFRKGGLAKPRNSVVTKENVQAILSEYQKTTGINFSKILSGVDFSGSKFSQPGGDRYRGSFSYNDKKFTRGKIYLNPNSINSIEELRHTLAHELGHSVDYFMGKGDFASVKGGLAGKYASRESSLQKQYDTNDNSIYGLSSRYRRYKYSKHESFANVFSDYVNGGDTLASKFNRRGFSSLVDGVAQQTGAKAPSLLKRVGRLFGFERGGQATQILRNDLLKRLGPAFGRRGYGGIDAEGLVKNLLVGNLKGSLAEFNSAASAVIIDPKRVAASRGESPTSSLLHEFFHAANDKAGAARGLDFGSDAPGTKLFEAGKIAEGQGLLQRMLPKATFEAYQKHYQEVGSNFLTDEALAQATGASVTLKARKNQRRLAGIPKDLLADIERIAGITIPEIARISQEGPALGASDPVHLQRIIKQMKAGRYAAGGLVPGTGNTDSVPTSLPFGSYVLRKSSTQQIGHENLAALAKGTAGRFASGGASDGHMPALVMPGEWIFSAEQARRIGMSKLDHMNKFGRFAAGGEVRRFASGGNENQNGVRFVEARSIAPITGRRGSGEESQVEIAKTALAERIKSLDPSKLHLDAVTEAEALVVSALKELHLAINKETEARNLLVKTAHEQIKDENRAKDKEGEAVTVRGRAELLRGRSAVLSDFASNNADDLKKHKETIRAEQANIERSTAVLTVAKREFAKTSDPADSARLDDLIRKEYASRQASKDKIEFAKADSVVIGQDQTNIKYRKDRIDAARTKLLERADSLDNQAGSIRNQSADRRQFVDAIVAEKLDAAGALRKSSNIETIIDAADNKTHRLPGIESNLKPAGPQFGTAGIQGLALERARDRTDAKFLVTDEQKLVAQNIEIVKLKQEYIDAVSSQVREAHKGVTLEQAQNIAAERFERITENNSQTLLKDKNGKITGDAALGAPASRRRRLLDGLKGLQGFGTKGAVFAAPIIASLGLNPGSAGDAVTSRSEGGFKTKSGISNAIQLGAAGSVFNPLAGAALAVYGFVDGMRDAKKQLLDAKLGVAAQDVADKLRAIAEGSLNLDPTVAASIVGKQGDISRDISTKARDDSFTGLPGFMKGLSDIGEDITGKKLIGDEFVGGTTEKFLAIRSKLQREEFGKQLPGIVQTLNASASGLGKNAPTGDRAALTKQFLEENDAFAQKQIDLISKIEGVAPKVVQERFTKVIAEAQRAQISRDANSSAIQVVNQNINSLELFSDSIRSAIDSVSSFGDKIQLVDQLFNGVVSGKIKDTASTIEGGGAFNRKGFTDAVGSVAGVFGEEGTQFTRLASGLSEAKLALPTILAQVRSRGDKENEDGAFPLEVQKRLRESLSPKVFDAQLNQILGVVSGTLNNEKFSKLIDESGGDVGKLAEKLLEPLSGPFKDAFSKAAKEMDGAAQRFVDGLAQATQRQQRILETINAADQKTLVADRFGAEIAARRAGKEGLGIDALSLRDLTRPFDRNQAALVKGLGVADPNNSKEIADALIGVTTKIEEAQKRQDAAQGGQFNGDAEQREFREASKAVIDLKSAAAQGQQALKNLADSTDRVSAIQEKLNRVKAKEDAQLGLAERFLLGDSADRAKLRRGQETFDDVKSGRVGVNDLSRSRREAFVDFAKANGPDGAAVLRNALGKVTNRDGRTIVEDGVKGERNQLEQDLLNTYRDQAAAAKDLGRVLTAYNDVSTKALIDSQNELVKQLRINNATLALSFKTAELGKSAERVGKATDLAKNLDVVKPFGIEDLDRAKLVYNNRADIENFRAKRNDINLIKNLGITQGDFFRAGGTVDGNIKQINEFDKIFTNAGITSGGARARGDSAELGLTGELAKRGFSRDLAGKISARATTNFAAISEARDDSELTPEERQKRRFQRFSALNEAIRVTGKPLLDESASPTSDFSKQKARIQAVPGLEAFTNRSDDELKKLFDALKPLTEANQPFTSVRDEAVKAADGLKSVTAELAAMKATLTALNPSGPKSVNSNAGLIGGVAYRAGGGIINFQPSGTDTVPAMLTPNEFVVNRASAIANRRLLEHINDARGPVYLAGGGRVFDDDARYGHFFRPNTVGGFSQQPQDIAVANGVPLRKIERDADIRARGRVARNKTSNEIYKLGRSIFANKRGRFNQQSNLLNGLGDNEILGLGRAGISDQRSLEANVLSAGNTAFGEYQNDFLQGRPEAKLKNLGFRVTDDPFRFAEGGPVPGVGNTDSVFARLTPGEFVFNKAATAAIGANNLLNAQKFATGGLVGGSTGSGGAAPSLQNPGSVSQAAKEMREPVNTFSSAVNVFVTGVDRFGVIAREMGEALKSKIQLEGKQQITVNVTGIPQGPQNERLRELVTDAVKDQLRRSLPNLF